MGRSIWKIEDVGHVLRVSVAALSQVWDREEMRSEDGMLWNVGSDESAEGKESGGYVLDAVFVHEACAAG